MSIKEPENHSPPAIGKRSGLKGRLRSEERFLELLCVVGGWSPGDLSCPVEIFPTAHDECRQTAPAVPHREDAAVCALGGVVYAVGGRDDFTSLSSVEKYDPETNTWSNDVAELSSKRSKVCLVEMDDHLFAIGGFDGDFCTNIVERYDPTLNSWMTVAPMNHRRAGAAAAVWNGYLYVVGGTNGNVALNSVERYSPLDDSWSVCPSMQTPRENPGCTVFLDHVYVVGGRDELSLELSTAERFDPETRRWGPVRGMRNKRHRVSLVVFDGRLLAAGGSDGILNLRTIEVYDQEKNSWRHFARMKVSQPGGHVTLVKKQTKSIL